MKVATVLVLAARVTLEDISLANSSRVRHIMQSNAPTLSCVHMCHTAKTKTSLQFPKQVMISSMNHP